MDVVSQSTPIKKRVLSGMRPTGALHLGHYHGALKNWVSLQKNYDCFYFVADWHALTTHYETPEAIEQHTHEMVIDWIAAGVDPEKATLFVQSKVPEHAELFLLLSMITPLSWLERVPTYKDQQEKLKDRDLSTYGFLGYPLMQAADILIYRAHAVPVGEDQVPHIEFTREVARRFNHIYGQDPKAKEHVESLLGGAASKESLQYFAIKKQFQETGDQIALEKLASLQQTLNLNPEAAERLRSFLSNQANTILPEPEVRLTEASKLPGLDGQKMSKSYGNTIALRDTKEHIEKKVKIMPTDPARIRRTDAGDPKRCPVWQFHLVYSDQETQQWVQQGCTTAGIGCIECKQRVSQSIVKEQEVMLERAAPFLNQPQKVKEILEQGSEQARRVCRETMSVVRQAMGIM
jgi:tryptophanyl-tRNA synthetase